MQLNIFKIPAEYLEWLTAKLESTGLEVLQSVQQDGWSGTFYFSSSPKVAEIKWLEPYHGFFSSLKDVPQNLNYFATFIFQRGESCYALSHGKAHFYLRPFWSGQRGGEAVLGGVVDDRADPPDPTRAGLELTEVGLPDPVAFGRPEHPPAQHRPGLAVGPLPTRQ